MTFQIHAICSADQLNQACSLLQQVYVNDGYTCISNAQEFMVQERFKNQSETIVATANDGKMLGVVLYLIQDSLLRQVSQANEREFRMLGVGDFARGMGVGQALVQACIDRARSEKAPALVLWTQPRMLAAHRLYERLGFQRVPDRDTWDDRGFNRLVYALDLAES